MPNACSDTSYQEHWLANEVLEGIPQIYEQTSEQFILQELNLHELGAVSFKKGCYTGQEIIARMKFLGKLKKRMFLLKTSSNSDLALEPGQDVYIKTTADERKKAGKLVRCHRLDSESVVALAVLNKELVDQESSATVGDSAEQTFAITGLEYNTK
jgi:folate-binding protein YgfZ